MVSMLPRALWAVSGKRPSSITKLRLISTMGGTWRMLTGQASIQAMHVVQAQSSSSPTFGAIGPPARPRTC